MSFLQSPAAESVVAAAPDRSPQDRAVTIAFRLASSGVAYCPRFAPLTGVALQTLDQFLPRDRASAVAEYQLDRGPRIIAVAPGSPGADAGLMASDVVLSANGRPVSNTPDTTAPFDQTRALVSVDAAEDRLVESAAAGSTDLVILRDGSERHVPLRAVMGCAVRLHVAQSNQQNAFADGVHVILPTGLIGRVQSDDQLALVIGHELAHDILGHAAAMRNVTGDAARRTLRRAQEDAADALGARLAQRAGYDLLAASKVFLLNGGEIELFGAHRDAKSRIRLTLAQAGLRGQGPAEH